MIEKYKERIDTLIGYAEEDEIVVSDDSLNDFNAFVSDVIPTDKAMLALTDDGNFRAHWKSGQSRLALEFVGKNKVHFVVFDKHYDKGRTLHSSGESSFDEIKTHVERWGLWSMVAS